MNHQNTRISENGTFKKCVFSRSCAPINIHIFFWPLKSMKMAFLDPKLGQKGSKRVKMRNFWKRGLSPKTIPYYLLPIFTKIRSIFSRNHISGQKGQRWKKQKLPKMAKNAKIAQFCEHSWTFFSKSEKMAKMAKNDIFDKKWYFLNLK